MLDKIRKVERVFKQLDKETDKFVSKSKLKCLTNCNLCCLKPGLEANVLEFLPFAYYLVSNNLHDAVLNLLDTEPEFCINLASTQVPGETSGCSAYAYRGLVCRLFGFSAIRAKNEKLAIYTCSHMKNGLPLEFADTTEKINKGLHVPMVAEYYSKIDCIDSQMANDYNPINVSIRKAIEKVAYYYSNKPLRKKIIKPAILTENKS